MARLSENIKEHTQLFFWQCVMHITASLLWTYGYHSDGGVFSNSAFGQAIESESLVIPPPRALAGTSTMVPFMFVGDEAFPLRPNLMRPYPGRYLYLKLKLY